MERTSPLATTQLPWWMTCSMIELPVHAIQDSNGDGIGDFPGLTRRLPEINACGYDVGWNPPCQPSGGKDRGYDLIDYRDIDPRYGTLDDFRHYVTESHRLGMKVVIDIVTAHTSDQHHMFQESQANPKGQYGNWYVWDPEGAKYVSYRDARGDKRALDNLLEPDNGLRVVRDADGDMVPARRWSYDETRREWYYHVFKRSQPALNYGSREQPNELVWLWMLENFLFWCELGVDGFRVDAAPFMFQEAGTSCEGLPAVHDFFRWLRRELNGRGFADVMLLCEADVPDLPAYVKPDEFQMGFGFRERTGLWVAMIDRDARRLDRAMAPPVLPAGCATYKFLSCHDDVRARTEAGWDREDQELLQAHYGVGRRGRPFMTDAVVGGFSAMLDFDRAAMELLWMMRSLLPGAQLDYYRDVIGMGHHQELVRDQHDARIALSTPMQWSPGPAAGFSSAEPSKLVYPVLSDPWSEPEEVNVAKQIDDPSSWLRFVMWVNALLKAHPILSVGSFQRLAIEDPDHNVWGCLRTRHDEGVVGLFNLAREEDRVARGTVPGYGNATLVDLFTDERIGEVRDGQIELPLAAQGYVVAALYR